MDIGNSPAVALIRPIDAGGGADKCPLPRGYGDGAIGAGILEADPEARNRRWSVGPVVDLCPVRLLAADQDPVVVDVDGIFFADLSRSRSWGLDWLVALIAVDVQEQERDWGQEQERGDEVFWLHREFYDFELDSRQ